MVLYFHDNINLSVICLIEIIGGRVLKTRDYLFDNAKGLLAFLVVFAHISQHANFLSEDYVDWVNRGIYLIHMPAFIFISGYFSKKNNPKGVINLVALYALWQMVISPMAYSFIKDIPFEKAVKPFFLPQATYWYLLSLIIWRVITPYFAKFKRPLLLSIILGVLIGFSSLDIDLQYFSYARTISFYPFFIIGYLCTKEKFYMIQEKVKGYRGFILFIGITALGIWLTYSVSPLLTKETRCMRFLVGKFAYEDYYINPYHGIWTSVVVYAIRFIAIFLFFSFIPRTKGVLTRIGEGSLFIYLTHWFVIEYTKRHYFQDPSYENGWAVLGFAFIATSMYCCLLTTKPFMKLGHLLTSINLNYFLKSDDEEDSKIDLKTATIAPKAKEVK